MKIRFSPLLITTLTCCWISTTFAQTSNIDCSYHANRLLEIPAKKLTHLLNRKTSQLQVMTYHKDHFEPILYQFEKKNITDTNAPDTFTNEDQLLVRAQDAGEIAPINIEKNYLEKITFNNQQAKGVFYIFTTNTDNNLPTQNRYSKKTGLLETDCFKLKTSPKNFLIWNGFYYKPLGEQANRNLLDTFKLRLSAKLLGPLPRMDADNSDITPILIATDEGPLRTRLLMKATVTVLKIPVTYIDMVWTVDNVSINNLVTVTIPPLLSKMVSEPYVSMSLDGRKLDGSQIFTSVNPKNPMQADGKMDAQETALNGTALNPNNNWIRLHLPVPLDISSRVSLPKNFNSPFSLLYLDDKNLADPPERFVGQEPNVGYQIHNFPLTGQFIFKFDLIFSNSSEVPPV